MGKLGDLAGAVKGALTPAVAAVKQVHAKAAAMATPVTQPLGRAWARLPLPVAFCVVAAVSAGALAGAPGSDTVAAAEASAMLASAQEDSAAARQRLGALLGELEASYPDPEAHDAGAGGGGHETGQQGDPQHEAATPGSGHETPESGAEQTGGHSGKDTGSDQGEEVDWGYKDPMGPSRWFRLSEEFDACAEAAGQSPVALSSHDVVTRPLQASTLALRAAPVTVSIDHHRVVATGDLGGATLNGVPYKAERVVLHTPAEHSIDGFTADAEIQVELRSASGGEAVVAIQVIGGSDNPGGASLAVAASRASAGPVPAGVLDMASLLPASPSAYRYVGSQTAPPCEDGVVWTVMANPVQFGLGQLSTLKSVTGPNARPQADLGHRTVTGGQLVP